MSKLRPSSPAAASEAESDQRALLLIRRVLCSNSPPTTPLESLLPALSSSQEVDIQLYAFVAIICRDFILSWYSNISTDHAFIDETIALIAHCTRALEERLRRVDLEALLLDEVPMVLDAHVSDYRRAVERHGTALAPYLSFHETFRTLQPHPAFPEKEQPYLRLLAAGILAVLLPPEDLESDCERSLLIAILSSTIFFNILDKLSEPFVIYEIITKILQPASSEPSPPSMTRNGRVKSPPPPPEALSPPEVETPISRLLSFLNVVFVFIGHLFGFFHYLLLAFVDPKPSRRPTKPPLVRTALPTFVFSFLNLYTLQPWLPATFQLLTRPFSSRRTTFGAAVDDLVLSQITPYFSSTTAVRLLRIGRQALFPADTLAPPRGDPDEKEKERIRTEAGRAVMGAVPLALRKWWWWKGLDEEGQIRELGKNWLAVFEDKEINRILIVRLMDLIIGRLFRELEENTGWEIMEERIGPLVPLPLDAETRKTKESVGEGVEGGEEGAAEQNEKEGERKRKGKDRGKGKGRGKGKK